MSSFFYFNQMERRGVLLFFLLIGLNLILPYCYHSFWSTPAKIEVDIRQLDTLPAPMVRVTAQSRIPDSLFLFDPNTAQKETLLRLGLPERTANTLLKYRQKGGRFYRKEDLKKIYGIEENWYRRVADHIDLPKQKTRKTSNGTRAYPNYAPKTVQKIAINTANAETWAQLRGIGPVLSNRIVKFRSKLGGFSRIEQVQETYGLPDSTFQSIQSQLELKEAPKKMNINQLSKEELAQHPYISWKLAAVIVNYRQSHGPFTDLNALKNIYILEEETLYKLEPYLNFCTECKAPDQDLTKKE